MSKELGALIRKQRKALALTQRELGDLAGAGLNFVSQLEGGKSSVRLDKVIAVLRVLGIELTTAKGKNGIRIPTELR